MMTMSSGREAVAPEDTAIGGRAGRFPSTRWSAIQGARSEDPAERSRSFGTLVAAYWRPVYKHIRIRWGKGSEDAKDLTQEFFARALEKEFFDSYDPVKGRFRTFLRTCLDGFLANEDKAARRLKRGAGVQPLPLEFETAEGEMAVTEIPSPDDIERYFDAEWVRSLFRLAVEALREECEHRSKPVPFHLFSRYDLEGPDGITYGDLAREFGIPETQVTNHLAFARREFRRLLLEKLREITVSDEEYRREARYLLGVEPD